MAGSLPRKEKFARKDVRLEFAALSRPVVLDALEAYRSRLCRACGIDVIPTAGPRPWMDLCVANLMCNQQRALAGVPTCLDADGAALFVEQRPRALQSRVPRFNKDEFELEVSDCGVREVARTERICAGRDDRAMQPCGLLSDPFEGVHLAALQLQELLLLRLAESRTSHGLLEGLLGSHHGFSLGLVCLLAK